MNKINRIKLLREQKNMKQEDLGKLLCVKKSTVHKYENSDITLVDEVLIKLSEIFDCSIDYILCNDKKFSGGNFNDEISNDEMKIISDYRNLDNVQRKILLGIVAFLRSPQSTSFFGNTINSNGGDVRNCFNSGNNCVMS